MSVDPLIGNLADSQSINPYAYVGNRPMNATDPTGFKKANAGGYAVQGAQAYYGGGAATAADGAGVGMGASIASSAGWAIAYYIFSGLYDHFYGPGPKLPPALPMPGSSGQSTNGVCHSGVMVGGQCNGWVLSMSGPGGVEIEDPMANPTAPPDLGDLFSSWYWSDKVSPETRTTIAANVMTVGGMAALCLFGTEAICASVLLVTCVQALEDGLPCGAAKSTATIVGRSVGAREAMWSGKKITNELAETLGVGRKELGRAVEKIKQGWGMRGDHNVTIGRATGDVYDSKTGELLGNVLDEIGR